MRADQSVKIVFEKILGKLKVQVWKNTPQPELFQLIQEDISQLKIDDLKSAKDYYYRNRTNKKYLSSDFSITAMYRLYRDSCPNPISLKLYTQCFHDLNLLFKKTCYRYLPRIRYFEYKDSISRRRRKDF